MKNNARAYFVERVIPSYATFVDYYNNREIGLKKDTFNAGNTAEALRDIPEHIFIELGSTIGFNNAYKYRESVSDRYKYYKIVCDLANVIKHRQINKNNPTFSSLDNIKESVACVRYDDILGKYYKKRKLLEITLSDGNIDEIGELLQKSILLWAKELFNFGVIPQMPKLPELIPLFVKRKDKRLDGEIIMLGHKGEYFEQQVRALIYNKGKNALIKSQSGKKFGKSKIPITFKIGASPFLEDEN
ncbi:MAG TPA: hypothetical protein VGC97_08755 [Pyrinomonadaceae bacterium]|jgi:hypothetical protein